MRKRQWRRFRPSPIIQRWREDPGGTYQSWFLWPERLNNLRSIRRGLQQVVQEIELCPELLVKGD